MEKQNLGNDHVLVVSVAAILFCVFYLIFGAVVGYAAGPKVSDMMPQKVGTGEPIKVDGGPGFTPKVQTLEDIKANQNKPVKDWHNEKTKGKAAKRPSELMKEKKAAEKIKKSQKKTTLEKQVEKIESENK